ncbi:hypothetical protein Trydic_g10862 [Trypoxylus dichotomus]
MLSKSSKIEVENINDVTPRVFQQQALTYSIVLLKIENYIKSNENIAKIGLGDYIATGIFRPGLTWQIGNNQRLRLPEISRRFTISGEKVSGLRTIMDL